MRFGIFSVVDHYPKELGRTAGEPAKQVLPRFHQAGRG